MIGCFVCGSRMPLARWHTHRASGELVLNVEDFVDVEVALRQGGLGLRTKEGKKD